MARILLVSYDVSLLGTRQLILQDQGHAVISPLGFTEALEQCQRGAGFDLFILGHSIPYSDKEALIAAFRARSAAPIVVLKKQGENPVLGANFEIEPDPEAVVRLVTKLVARRIGAAVVFTGNPPGPEMIEDGVSGLLADPASPQDFAEKTSKILDTPSLAAGLTMRARKRVAERFSLEQCLQATEHFYEECLRQSRQPAAAHYLPQTLPIPLPHRH